MREGLLAALCLAAFTAAAVPVDGPSVLSPEPQRGEESKAAAPPRGAAARTARRPLKARRKILMRGLFQSFAEVATAAPTLPHAPANHAVPTAAAAAAAIEPAAASSSSLLAQGPIEEVPTRDDGLRVRDDIHMTEGRYDRDWSVPLSCFVGMGGESEHIMNRSELLTWTDEPLMRLCDRKVARMETRQAAASLLGRLDAAASRTDCSDASALMEVQPMDTGWNSLMHSMVKPMMKAVETNRTLLSPAMRMWAHPASCAKQDISCFFKPLAPTCDASRHPLGAGAHHVDWDADGRPILSITDAQGVERSQVDLREGEAGIELSKPSTHPTPVSAHSANGYDALVPEPFKPLGWLGYTTALLGWLARPNELLEHKLRVRLATSGLGAALSFGKPVIGMHVRLGDACADGWRTGRSCDPLKTYMKVANRIRRDTGASTIYLATDTPDIVEQTKDFPEWTFLRMREPMEAAADLHKKSAGATRLGFPDQLSSTWDDVMRFNHKNGNADLNRRSAMEAQLDVYLLSVSELP